MKYQRWINKNTKSLEGKLVVFVGATGSIGLKALEYILSLKANTIIGARNTSKALKIKEGLLSKFPNAKIDIMQIDVSSKQSVLSFVDELKKNNIKPDYFVNNAGVYHLNDSKSVDGVEIHFATNAFGNGILTREIIPLMNINGHIILTSSISYNFEKTKYNDIEALNEHNKLKKYSLTKRAMLMNTLYLKSLNIRDDVSINMAHPGICATELFQKSHSKAFMKLVFPIMKVIFHSPSKASLSVVKALFVETSQNYWIGPRGLFHAWGYPKIYKIKKNATNLDNCKKINEFMLEMEKKAQ